MNRPQELETISADWYRVAVVNCNRRQHARDVDLGIGFNDVDRAAAGGLGRAVRIRAAQDVASAGSDAASPHGTTVRLLRELLPIVRVGDDSKENGK